MSNSSSRMSRKLIAAFTALSVVFLLVSGMLAVRVSSAHQALEADEYGYRMLELSDAMMAALANQQDAVRGYVAKPDPQFLGFYAKAGQRYDAVAATFDATAKTAQEHADAAQIAISSAQFHREAEKLLALAGAASTLEQARASIVTTARLHQVRETVRILTERQHVARGLRRAAERRSFDSAMATLALGSTVTLLLSATLAWSLARSLRAEAAQASRATAAGPTPPVNLSTSSVAV